MRIFSSRTSAFLLVAFGLVIAIAFSIAIVGTDTFAMGASDIGEAIIVTACAAVIFMAARRFGPGPLQRNWMLVGTGVALFAVGDIVWSVLELAMGNAVPYPSAADIFYVLEYVFLGAGLALAGLAYRTIVDVRRPVIISAVVTAVMALGMWFAFISPLIVAGTWNAETILSSVYPLADVIFLFGPTLMIVLVIAQLGGGRLGWPWWSVGAGVLILAVTDSVYSYLTAIDVYRSGTPLDYGWMIGHIAIALGALIADDLAHPQVLQAATTDSKTA